jgi:hypothetical protein
MKSSPKSNTLRFAFAAAALAASFHAAAMSNAALTGTASQSSVWNNANYTYSAAASAALAIDGNTDGMWNSSALMPHSVSHTDIEPNAWWQVQLNASYLVSSIVVFNRIDNNAETRLNTFSVQLFSAASQSWIAAAQTYLADVAPNGMTFNLATPMVGDRVRVTLDGTNYLNLAEVQVMATPVPEPSTWAMALAGLAAVSSLARRRMAR